MTETKLPPVAELLSREEAWIQGLICTDVMGNAVDVEDREACKFCLWGAMMKVYGSDSRSEAYQQAEDRLTEACGREDYIAWNEKKGRTQAEVIALCIKAGV